MRSQLGVLVRLGQGGQGVVFGAPAAQTTFSKSMVYKEYRPAVLSSLNVDALRALPDFLESLPYIDGARLISMASWPCALVEDGGRISGFIMPAIPDEFFVDFRTSSKPHPSRVSAEFQHVLNDPHVVAARFGGVVVSDKQKFELMSQMASALLFLHERDVCVGDISPKNLLFSLTPASAVYFVDCDAMRVKGVSLAHQVETPGWEVPAGEEKATVFSDRYKLGLLALRLILGSQDSKDAAMLPASVPSELRQIIASTLTSPPHQRPPLTLWITVLAGAIATASQRTTPPAPPPSRSAPRQPPLLPSPASSGSAVATSISSRKSKMGWLMIPAALLALFVIVKLASTQTGGTSMDSASSSTPSVMTSASSSPSTWTSTTIVTSTSVTTITQAPRLTPSPTVPTIVQLPTTVWSAPVPTMLPVPTVDPEVSAASRMSQIVASDRPFVIARLADVWIPQLSSKRPGTYDNGLVWDNVLTLQEHLDLRQRYNARLLWSGDWSTFDESNYWVTVAPYTFSTPDGALQWCVNQGFDSNHCFAKLVSTTHPIAGSTKIGR